MKRASRARRRLTAKSQLWIETLESRVTPAMLMVANLNDSGLGSLRQAILDANLVSGADTIDFSVTGKIQLTSGALPAITDTVDIDGTSAPGFANSPAVEVDMNGFAGLTFDAGSANSGLHSLSIVNANGAGVTLNDSNIVVAGNYIGLALDGSTSAGNVGDGLIINSTSTANIIGGTIGLDRNVISANTGNGIRVDGSSRNQIEGNYIGTDAADTQNRGNDLNGVLLTNGAAANDVGGTIDQQRNLISGNEGDGVLLEVGAHDNTVLGNFIGTDASGATALGNGQNGVEVNNADSNVIGNTVPVAGVTYFNAQSVSPTPNPGWTGIRASDTAGQYLISGISGTEGILFEGTIAGAGVTVPVNFPISATTNASATAIYGPDNLGGNNVALVGSYNTTGTGLADQKGFIFEGTTADLSNPANFTTIDAGGDFNIVHSTMGGLAVGNSDTSPSQGQGSLLAHAFLYDVAQKQFLPDIVFPGSVSNTAYGIWYNGGTSYTICGGWSSNPVNNFDDQDRPIGQGYLVDFDSATQAFTHWTTFEYPFGTNFFTHFEGISSIENGVYTLNADSLQAGTTGPTQGSWVSVRRNSDGSFSLGQWVNLSYPGAANITSSNSVYGNQVIGVVFDGSAPFAFQATVNIGFQLSNVISGNGANGVLLTANAQNNTVATNFIGTDLSGSTGLGNSGNGILVTAGSNQNLIGGVDTGGNNPTGDEGNTAPVFVRPPQGNLISGNDANGVLIDDLATQSQLSGNFIGTTASGDSALGNALDGVAIDNAPGNSLIGCTFQQDPFVFYNVIDGNGGNGLRVTNSDNTTFQANFLGLGADNSTPVGNALDGALINGSSANIQFGGVIPLGNVDCANGRNGVEIADTAVGGTYFNTFCGIPAFIDTTEGNTLDGFLVTSTGGNNKIVTTIISGNGSNGVHITGNATGVQVEDAIIGLNTDGNGPIPNGANGVLIDGNSHGNIIGGFQPSVAIHNTISSNGAYGIAIVGNASDNTVITSFVGTDVGATSALGNGSAGIFVGGNAQGNIIGGTNPGDQNLISANLGGGIQLGGQSQGTQIINNLIGTNATGLMPVGNHGNGITIASSKNSIGGTASGQGNVVAFNSQYGVVVDAGTGNSILSNSIFSNGDQGILLTTGGNLAQPAPVLTLALQTTGLAVQITGTLTATPNTTYTVQIFASPSATPAGQGRLLIGSVSVTTNASGVANISLDATLPSSSAAFITATATDPNNNTSMFSSAIGLTTPNQIYVQNAYQLLLNRAADPSSVFWVNALNSGSTPATVVLGIELSSEYLNDQVFALYGRYLGRTPESSGAQFWTNFLLAGGTFEQVAESLVSSPEYFLEHGATNQGFVLGLYDQVLGRVPSLSDLNAWLNVLNAGASRQTVATDFLTSLEYRQELVESDYTIYLGRAADTDGLHSWVSALFAGSTDQEVLAGIFGSQEGYAKWS